MNLLSDHINLALRMSPGRKLIVAHDARIPGFFAILDFNGERDPIGGTGPTPDLALADLELELSKIYDGPPIRGESI